MTFNIKGVFFFQIFYWQIYIYIYFVCVYICSFQEEILVKLEEIIFLLSKI